MKGGQEQSPARGLAYTLSVPRQQNIILTVTRAVNPGAASGQAHFEMLDRLRSAAAATGSTAGFAFDTQNLIARDFHPL